MIQTMRWIFIAAALIALPGQVQALSADDARHLLVRTGFAAPVDEVEAISGLSRAQAVSHILAKAGTEAGSAPPDFVGEPWVDRRTVRRMSADERQTFVRQRFREGRELKAWWYREMLETRTPVTEVMTLFWHNHFTSSLRKTRSPVSMYRQNVLFRRHALGNFADLAHAVARDPAMVIYLDTARSRANAPNENFARELLELFTLGVGHYTEDDIKAIARAFTGYSLAPATGEFAFRPAIHDNGSKTVLGQTGMFDGDEIIDILLAHPRTAETVVEQLWRQFISSEPDRGEIVALAATFRTDLAYEIEPLMHALLTSDAFWAQENRAALIKSPVDFLIGTLRQFDTELPRNNQRGNRPGNLLVLFGRELGQDIFDPPNVKGWPGGEAWITSQTLLLRNDIALALTGLGEGVAADLPPELSQGPLARDTLRDMEPDARRQLLMARGMERLGQAMTRSIDRWIVDLSPDWRDAGAMTQLLLARPPADMSADVMEGEVTGALLRRVVTDPVYQLK